MPSTHNGKVHLAASAAYGYGGKQFIARITGRHPKFTFEYDFLGRKEGKRGESTSFTVDEPGLYVERDLDRKGGVTETFVLVFADPGAGVDYVPVTRDEAMDLAKLGPSECDARGRSIEAARLEKIQADAAGKDPDEVIEAKSSWPLFGIVKGEMHPRRVIMFARAQRIAALLGGAVLAAPAAPDADARARVVAQVREMMAAHGITVADLAC